MVLTRPSLVLVLSYGGPIRVSLGSRASGDGPTLGFRPQVGRLSLL